MLTHEVTVYDCTCKIVDKQSTDSKRCIAKFPLNLYNLNVCCCGCSDIAALARAAVSGDESALDMFNWKQKGKQKGGMTMMGSSEAMSFYIGTNNGKLFFCAEASIFYPKVLVFQFPYMYNVRN